MNPTTDKIQKLIARYPFLTEVMQLPLHPVAPVKGLRQIDDLSIKVEKADAFLMYRQANNTGLELNSRSSSWIAPFEGPRKDQAGRRGEYMLAIDHKGKIVNRIEWPRSRFEDGAKQPVYGWHVFWTGKTRCADGSIGYTNPIWNQVKYLVWVTVHTWHTSIKGFEGKPFGDFIERTMNVTIYTAPKQGFEALEEEANVYEHLHLNNDVTLKGMFRNDRDIMYITGMLMELCHQFKTDVYDNGMRAVADSHPTHRIAASGQFGSVGIMVAELCGYERIQLDDDSSRISLQIAPGSTHAHVHSMDGKLPQLRNLIRTANEYWNHRPGGRDSFIYNEQVRVG